MRYFLVAFLGTLDGKQITGNCTFSCDGFLNREKCDEFIETIAPGIVQIIYTFVLEISHNDHERWGMKTNTDK